MFKGRTNWWRELRGVWNLARRLDAEGRADPEEARLSSDVRTPASLEEAVAILEDVGLEKPRRMDPIGEDAPQLDAVCLNGPLPLLRAVARKHGEAWNEAGLCLWLASRGGPGFPSDFPAELGVAAGTSWEDVLRFMGTCEWGPEGEAQAALVEILRGLDEACGIVLTEIEAGAISGRLQKPLEEPELWAARIVETCAPQGPDGDLERSVVEAQLARGELALEWDDPR